MRLLISSQHVALAAVFLFAATWYVTSLVVGVVSEAYAPSLLRSPTQSKSDDVAELVAEIGNREGGKLHVLVNNAGTNWSQEFGEVRQVSAAAAFAIGNQVTTAQLTNHTLSRSMR